MSRKGPRRDAEHFISFRDCPGQSGNLFTLVIITVYIFHIDTGGGFEPFTLHLTSERFSIRQKLLYRH